MASKTLAFLAICAGSLQVAAVTAPAIAQEADPAKISAVQLKLEQPRFSYWDAGQVEATKREIAADNPFFVARYAELMDHAERLLSYKPDPVVNKPTVPPSGDKHDYLSLGPYWWPDPDQPDGLPWIARDGVINPATRGSNTDQVRQKDMTEALRHLNLAYFLSGEQKYGDKILDILRIWFLDPETRVNPNIEFGQGVPGRNTGRPIGVIEWTEMKDVVTSVELVTEAGLMPLEDQVAMRDWFTRYVDWLINSPIGIAEDVQPQNHGTWYDVQALSLLIHLGRLEEARRRALDARADRIAVQIEPDGSMPKENHRTKSVNYNSMNREGMVHIARLAAHVGVDLVNYETEDGRSLKTSLEHLVPWAHGEMEWPYQQIEYGGPAPAIEIRMQPMMLFAGDVLDIELLEPAVAREAAGRAGMVQVLSFPPRIMMNDTSE